MGMPTEGYSTVTNISMNAHVRAFWWGQLAPCSGHAEEASHNGAGRSPRTPRSRRL